VTQKIPDESEGLGNCALMRAQNFFSRSLFLLLTQS
jgi:hypothetical protein